MSTRYYNPEIGRFLNTDAFVSTGQGLLGNNMFAYCGNNAVINADYSGEFTIAVSFGRSCTAFVGISDSYSLVFDGKGNIEIQKSHSRPDKRETTTIGLLSAGSAVSLQVTSKKDVSELRGVSTYLGFSNPSPVGFDVVSDSPVADNNGELIGAQISWGGAAGGGVDVHVAQTYTETIKRFTWRDVGKWLIKVFQ